MRGKTYAAQHAQGVVRERHVRVERRAYDTVFKVGQAVEGVYQFAETGLVEAYRHGVYGEVAAVLVVLQRAVLHYRLARVVAVALLPGAYKLHFHVLILHLGGAEITEYGQPCPLAELLFKRLGNANAAAYHHHVDIVRRPFEEQVAHVSAYDVAFEAQRVGHGRYFMEYVFIKKLRQFGVRK